MPAAHAPTITDCMHARMCSRCRRRTILQRLSQIQAAPSVAFHERAPDGMDLDDIQVLLTWQRPGTAQPNSTAVQLSVLSVLSSICLGKTL